MSAISWPVPLLPWPSPRLGRSARADRHDQGRKIIAQAESLKPIAYIIWLNCPEWLPLASYTNWKVVRNRPSTTITKPSTVRIAKEQPRPGLNFTSGYLGEERLMNNLLLADDLELFALQDDLQSLGVSPSLIMAAAVIRSQAREIMALKEELETARGGSSMKKPSNPFN